MEFLQSIWNAVSENWTATTALIMSTLALLDRVGKFYRSIKQWSAWGIPSKLSRTFKRQYQSKQAERAMSAYIKNTPIRVPTQTHERCLTECPTTRTRSEFANVGPSKPSWLSDYHMATALETLHREGKIAKGRLYNLNHWPPDTWAFLFENPHPGETAAERTELIETESQCRAEQRWLRDTSIENMRCTGPARYIFAGYSETQDAQTVHHGITSTLEPDAPPCLKCWETRARENNIRGIAKNIAENDINHLMTQDITGENHEFLEAVITTCVNTKNYEPSVGSMVDLMQRMVEVRLQQTMKLPVAQRSQWNNQTTKEFVEDLEAYLKVTMDEDSQST